MNGPRAIPIAAVWAAALTAPLFLGDVDGPRGPDGTGGTPSWTRDVRPILAENCFQCHGPDERARKARLRLDVAEGLASERDAGRVVAAGDADASELWRRVTAGDDERMPPPEHGPALGAGELDVLRRWIEAGAEWEPHWAYAPFRDVAVPEVADAAWPRNPIDRFVLARLEREGLAPAPEADRRTLLRRVTLDLIGMGPTREELALFLADGRPDAYERAVDRLLASPHYAERQARHWLDVARYADSNGFTIDGGRSMWPWRDWVIRAIDGDMPYDRFTLLQLAGDLLPDTTVDDVVATGFHRNTQINEEGGAKDEENRVAAVIDRVNTTGAVWLGSTLACAQCHSHKFDPVSQTEYYRMLAFFDQTQDGGVTSGPRLDVPPRDPDSEDARALRAFEAERARLAAALAAAQDDSARGWTPWRPTRLYASEGPELAAQPDGSIRSVGHNPQTSLYVLEGRLPAGGVGAFRLEALPSLDLPRGGPGRTGSGNFVLSRVRASVRDAGAAEWRAVAIAGAVADFEQDNRAEGGSHQPVAAALDDDAVGWAVHPRVGEPHAAVFGLAEPLAGSGELRVELQQDHGSNHVLGRFRLLVRAGQAVASVDAAVAQEWRDAWAAFAEHEGARPKLPTVLVMRERGEPRVTRLFERGSFLDLGPEVTPGFPAAMDAFARGARATPPRDRRDLARWLTHPDNALAHRVTVNRWWQEFFGLGLVATENDFGLRGARPSHPELLDWLAREFVRSGFSRKALQRLIVTSATYRQSSRPAPAGPKLIERDPANRLLARQSRLRLDAESIRDSALRASGLLAPERFGPPVQPPQPDGVYAFTQSKRKWQASEGPDRYRRTLYTRLWRSAVHPFLTTFDAPVPSQTCTRRLRSTTALQALALANDPMFLELAAGLGERARSGAGNDETRLRRAFELCTSREPTPEELDVLRTHLADLRASGADEQRAWTAVARVLMNLDEFVTRE